jgi:hypothetical protein
MPKGRPGPARGASYYGAPGAFKPDVDRADLRERLAERDARMARAGPDDANRAVLGDPPPGRSALDHRRSR